MKAKNVLTLLAVVVGIMIFALPAGADEYVPVADLDDFLAANPDATKDDYNDYNRSDGVGITPCKCEMGNVPCPKGEWVTTIQDQQNWQAAEAAPFDFDGTPYVEDGFGSYGYCQGFNYADDPTRDCKFFFDVCTCDEACELTAGAYMGIQMYILTDGVYWDSPGDKIHFAMYNSTQCPTDGQKYPLKKLMDPATFYKDKTGKFVSGVDAAQIAEQGSAVRYFGGIQSYAKLTQTLYNEKYKFVSTPSGTGARVLESAEASDYLITVDDAQAAQGNCKIWIDIPAMKAVPSAMVPGTPIKVQVRLLFEREPDVICPQCSPPVVCDTVVQVGVMCCDSTVVDQDTGGIFFPYVFQSLDNWSSGIAVSALDREQLPEDAYCELTIKDQEGNIATWKKTDMGNKLVWAFVLDQIMSSFAMTQGTALVPGAASLEIRSNYRMDGYSFMMADMDGSYFGAGTLARGIGGKCCP